MDYNDFKYCCVCRHPERNAVTLTRAGHGREPMSSWRVSCSYCLWVSRYRSEQFTRTIAHIWCLIAQAFRGQMIHISDCLITDSRRNLPWTYQIVSEAFNKNRRELNVSIWDRSVLHNLGEAVKPWTALWRYKGRLLRLLTQYKNLKIYVFDLQTGYMYYIWNSEWSRVLRGNKLLWGGRLLKGERMWSWFLGAGTKAESWGLVEFQDTSSAVCTAMLELHSLYWR